MATKYVRSTTGNDSTNGGTSWSDAYATVLKALANCGAGGTVYVSQVHAETQASAMTLVSQGTPAAPATVLCANDGATPPTAMATTATVSTTGANAISFGSGFAYVYGVTFLAGSAANAANLNFNGAAQSGWWLESCGLALNNTSGTSVINFSSLYSFVVDLLNCTLTFGAAGQTINSGGGPQVDGKLLLRGCTLAGTSPTSLINTSYASNHNLEFSGCDLSNVSTNLLNLAGVNTYASTAKLKFRNCLLKNGIVVAAGAYGGFSYPGMYDLYLENCDSTTGGTNYRMEHWKYQGSIKTEATKVRSGGASDGTTPVSHNFTSSAYAALYDPLIGPWMSIWNATTGTAKSLTVEVCTENVVLTNQDVWIEIEYLGTSGCPQSVYANDRIGQINALAGTTANLTTSAATWSGFTTPTPQNLSLTFTPQQKGVVRARVCMAKASATAYIDPVLTVV